jgi:2-polyprenyl-3-methyl-5-hydroxy-6-metoxy-1,4-benzoquinol methylase
MRRGPQVPRAIYSPFVRGNGIPRPDSLRSGRLSETQSTRGRVLVKGTDSTVGERLSATIDLEAPAAGRLEQDEPFDYTTIPAGHYDRVYRRRRGIQSKWHHLKFERVAQQIGDRRRVLDIGCGPGTLLGALGDGHQCVGVDITEPQIEYANQVYAGPNCSFYACALQDLPELEPFDAVSAIEVIEHLPSEMAKATMRDAIRRLRPGGKLILTTPDYGSAWPLVERMVDRLGDVEYYVQHINKFTPPRLQTLLEDLGLVEVRVRKYLFAAPFAALFGWRSADLVARAEAGRLENRFGLIMLGTAVKPA